MWDTKSTLKSCWLNKNSCLWLLSIWRENQGNAYRTWWTAWEKKHFIKKKLFRKQGQFPRQASNKNNLWSCKLCFENNNDNNNDNNNKSRAWWQVDTHVIRVYLAQPISIQKSQVKKKSPCTLAHLVNFSKKCLPRLIVIQSCFDYWINKPFACSRCVICVSCGSRDLVLRAQRIIDFFYLNYPQINEVGKSHHTDNKIQQQPILMIYKGRARTVMRVRPIERDLFINL